MLNSEKLIHAVQLCVLRTDMDNGASKLMTCYAVQTLQRLTCRSKQTCP